MASLIESLEHKSQYMVFVFHPHWDPHLGELNPDLSLSSINMDWMSNRASIELRGWVPRWSPNLCAPNLSLHWFDNKCAARPTSVSHSLMPGKTIGPLPLYYGCWGMCRFKRLSGASLFPRGKTGPGTCRSHMGAIMGEKPQLTLVWEGAVLWHSGDVIFIVGCFLRVRMESPRSKPRARELEWGRVWSLQTGQDIDERAVWGASKHAIFCLYLVLL